MFEGTIHAQRLNSLIDMHAIKFTCSCICSPTYPVVSEVYISVDCAQWVAQSGVVWYYLLDLWEGLISNSKFLRRWGMWNLPNKFKFLEILGRGCGVCKMWDWNIWLTLAAVDFIVTSSVSRRGLIWEEGRRVGTTRKHYIQPGVFLRM